MKFVMVVYMCLAGVCESVYEENFYDTLEECQIASQEVMEYSKRAFPMGSGKIWCFSEDEFKNLVIQLGNET